MVPIQFGIKTFKGRRKRSSEKKLLKRTLARHQRVSLLRTPDLLEYLALKIARYARLADILK